MLEEASRSKYALSVAVRREATNKNLRLHRSLESEVQKLQNQQTLSQQLLIRKRYLIKLESLQLKHAATRLNSRDRSRPMSAPSAFRRPITVNRPVTSNRQGRKFTQGNKLRSWAGLDCIEEYPIVTQRRRAKQPMSAYSVQSRATDSAASRRPNSAQTYNSRDWSRVEQVEFHRRHIISQGGQLKRAETTTGYMLAKRRFTII